MRSLSFACLVAALTMCACSQAGEHIVGSGRCSFNVPSAVQLVSVQTQAGTDATVQSIYLRVKAGALDPALSPVGDGEFRFIASCEAKDENTDIFRQLSDVGVVAPMRNERESGTDLFRIYKGEGNSAWVLVDFDPERPRSSQDRIVGNCYLLSSSAHAEYSCVHSVRRRSVRIEYHFGPEQVEVLAKLDQAIFALLERGA